MSQPTRADSAGQQEEEEEGGGEQAELGLRAGALLVVSSMCFLASCPMSRAPLPCRRKARTCFLAAVSVKH